MFKLLINKLPILLSAIAVFSQICLPVYSNPSVNLTQSTNNNQNNYLSPYEKAKVELPEDFYVLYRIIDRIARANQLNSQTWRIAVVPEYEINAFASDVNLIAIYSGILDQLGSDASAIACVVSHEMVHHINRHIAVGQAEEIALTEKLKKEAIQQAEAELKKASQPTGLEIFSAILTGVSVGLDNSPSNQAQANQTVANLENARNQRIIDAQERAKQIFQIKQNQLQQEIAANNRRQEFEADEMGYELMVKAGFEPEGCIRMMEVLARIPGAEIDTSHPAVLKRIERLKELMRENPPESLAVKGDLFLQTDRIPLTYDLSKDGTSLRINSKHGGSAVDVIDSQFGL